MIHHFPNSNKLCDLPKLKKISRYVCVLILVTASKMCFVVPYWHGGSKVHQERQSKSHQKLTFDVHALICSTIQFSEFWDCCVLREEEGEDQRGRCQGPGPPRLGCCCCWVIGSTKSHTINHNSHTRLSSWEWWPPFPADYKQCHLLLVHTRQHIDFVCYEKKLTLGNQKDFKKISIPHKYLA